MVSREEIVMLALDEEAVRVRAQAIVLGLRKLQEGPVTDGDGTIFATIGNDGSHIVSISVESVDDRSTHATVTVRTALRYQLFDAGASDRRVKEIVAAL